MKVCLLCRIHALLESRLLLELLLSECFMEKKKLSSFVLSASVFVIALLFCVLAGCGNGKMEQIKNGAKNVEQHAQDIENEAQKH